MKKTIVSRLLPCLLALLLTVQAATPVFATSGFTYLFELSNRVNEFIGGSVPGVAVSVVDLRNGFAFSKGYGYSDADKTVPVTEDTLFQVSGVSASFTALLALQMAEKGEIDLDAKVSKYVSASIPSSPVTGGNIENVTVRMLMENISGFPDYYFPNYYSFDQMDGTAFNNLASSLSNEHMSFKPHENVSDSQVATAFLGYLLAKTAYPESTPATGFVKLSDGLLEQLNMTNSSFWLNKEMEPLLSYTFDAEGQPTEKLPVASGLMPAASLWSSASEMKNYLHFLLDKGWYNGNQLMNVRSFSSLFEPNEDAVYYKEDNYYGLTWFVENTPWGAMYRLDGGGAYPSALIVHPEQRVGIFITCNSAAGISEERDVAELAYELITELLTDKLDLATWQAQAHVDTIDKVWDQLTDFTGYYYGNFPDPVEVTRENGILYITHPQTGAAIGPEEDGRYITDNSGGWFAFKKMEDTTGKVYLLQNGYPIAMKMSELKPSLNAGSFYGEWVSQGEDARYLGLSTLVIEKDEKDLARVNGTLLGFLSKDIAYTYGFGQGGGLLLKRGVDEKGNEFILFSGERYYRQ